MEGITLYCPLCVKPFPVCHSIVCRQDEFLNHHPVVSRAGTCAVALL